MDNSLKKRVRQILISDYGTLFSKESPQEGKLRDIAANILNNLLLRERISITNEERGALINELIDEFLGFGPIQGLLNDPAVTEIMINGPKKVYAERKGKMQLTDVSFENEEQLMYMVYKIIAPTRRRVDESYPYAEVAISDGSRVNIIIPPLALDGTAVTIRKFSKEINTADDLVKLGSLDKRMSDFLIAAVKAKVNIVFSGATGAGKTTALNAFSSYIPEDERIVTIEDIAELRLQQEHLVRLEARQASIEGRGEVTIRDLFKNSLRMRPDRIIIGEIRGSEALEMLQAICSGHKGSMAVLHAESPQDVIYRIETMILTSGLPITLAAIQRQIAAAVNLIVQQEQLVDGSRKITHITQVNGLKNDTVVLEDLFVYNIESIDSQGKVKGHWKATGIQPCFSAMFHKAGVNLPKLG